MEYEKIALNTARNCFRYVIGAFNIKEIYIPYYLCPVMRIIAVKEHCKVRFYHIDRNFFPVCIFPSDAYILYPNYFGVCSKNVAELAKKYKNLIVDNAHAFYAEPCGIASFNSVRKFFPEIRDGAFLYIKDVSPVSVDYSDDKEYEYKIMSEKEFILNENRLDNEEIKYMSKTSLSYFNSLNLYELGKEKRNHFDNLNNIYIDKNLLKFKLSKNDIPYKYPLLCDNTSVADTIVKKYQSKGFKIFRYWENLPESFPEKIFRDNLVSI